jgi:ubiquinone/menaquinone biosynthesis C-methylase UbiE
MGSRFSRVWLFDVGAWAYNAFSANEIWRGSCARLLDHVPPGQGQHLALDLGTGPGVSALAMGRQRPDVAFIGLDLSKPMLAFARNNRSAAGWPPQRLSLLRADALQVPLAGETVDVVTGHSFFYLIPDPQAALAEIGRVLRPGGQLAFLEPHAGQGDWGWLLRQGSLRLLIAVSLWRPYSRLHTRFSADSLRLLFEQAGFKNITMEVTLGGFGIVGRAQKP